MVKKSISTVLVLSSSIAIVVAVTVMVLFVSRSSYNMAVELSEQSIRQSTDETMKTLFVFMENAKHLAKVLSVQNVMAQALQHGDITPSEERLRDYMQTYNEYYTMLVFDTNGKVVVGIDDQGNRIRGVDISSRPYVKAVLSGTKLFVGKDVFRATTGDKPRIIAIAHLVTDKAGRGIGGVAVFPKWDTFTRRFIDPLRFGARGYGFMLDPEGTFIAHAADKNLIGESVAQQFFVREALAKQNGSIKYDWHGEEKFMTFQRLPETGWIICMSAYVSDLAVTATNQRNILLAIGFCIVVLLVCIIIFFVRRLVVRPILAIEAFTGSVAQGNFSAVLDNNFKYELSHLADNIRIMVGELKNKLGFSQGLLDGMTISCIVIDAEEKIVFVNKAVLDFLEHDGASETYKGMDLSRFFYGEGRARNHHRQGHTGTPSHPERAFGSNHEKGPHHVFTD